MMSNIAPTLAENLIEGLAASTDAAAVLEQEIRQRINNIRAASETNPFANIALLAALDVSRRIDQNIFELQDFMALVRRLSVRSFLDRAIRQRTYLGEIGTAISEAAIRDIIRQIAGNGVVPFEAFQRRVECPIFGIVLTAHPTFGMSVDVARILAILTSNTTPSGDSPHPRFAEDMARTIDAASFMPPPDLTLDMEHRWSLEVLGYLQGALERTTEILLDVAAEIYPDRWSELTPCPITIASWVGYDLDGRSDIIWTDTLAKRLLVKHAQLERLRHMAEDIAASDPAVAAAMRDVGDELLASAVAVNGQLEATARVVGGTGNIGPLARAFMNSRDAAMVSTANLRARLDVAVQSANNPEAARKLVMMRASAKWQGLSLAHTHVRLNATQLHNAIRRQVGMESPPTDPAYRRRYVTSINDLLSRVSPETINFATLSAEQATAKRLFMIVQQIVKYIDAETPVRFLIAETEAAFTLLTALYFARLFGVEDRVEISPLFETADAIEHGDAILEEALRSPFYRDYVERAGRLCVQFGFSDSGRYLGQMAATFQLERLRLRIATVMERQGLTGIQLVLFNTHGESIGRGGHPASLHDRFRYVAPPFTRARFAEAGIRVKEEVSFQGGDGFALLMSAPAALTVVSQALQAFAEPDPEAVDDPIYEAGDYAVEFFASIRQAFAALADDPNYLVLLSVFGTNLSPRTGSRPAQRQQEGLIASQRYTDVSQLRAIPNNGILQQLAFLANTIHGVGVARAQDPELFDQMCEISARFRRAVVMVDGAVRASDIEVFKAYVDLLDPGSWLARSALARSRNRATDLRLVAAHLERLDLNPALSKLYRRLQRDFLLLTDSRSVLTQDGQSQPRHETLVLLHILRLACLQRLFLLAMQIPEFSPQRGVSREQLIARVMGLDVVAVVAQLRQIFPKSAPLVQSSETRAEPASYRGDVLQGYAREHDMIFDPLMAHYQLILELGNSISMQIGAVG